MPGGGQREESEGETVRFEWGEGWRELSPIEGQVSGNLSIYLIIMIGNHLSDI